MVAPARAVGACMVYRFHVRASNGLVRFEIAMHAGEWQAEPIDLGGQKRAVAVDVGLDVVCG